VKGVRAPAVQEYWEATMATKPAAWSVLVYMAGDNNLTEEMVWGLQELSKAADQLRLRTLPAGKRINVVAHYDPRGVRPRRYDIVVPRSPSDSGSAQGNGASLDGQLEPYERWITQKAVKEFLERLLSTAGSSALQSAAQGDSDQTESADDDEKEPKYPVDSELSMFVLSQILQLPPAERYFLVLSGHGSGAEGDFLNDAEPGTGLSIPELAWILEQGIRLHEKIHGKKARILVLGMDSCLMSNAEVCYEVCDFADYLVASEGFVENTGWPYHRVLEALIRRSRKGSRRRIVTEGKIVATTVAEKYSRFYRDYEVSGVSTDIAACDLRKLRRGPRSPFIDALTDLSTHLIPPLEDHFAMRVVENGGLRAGEAALETLAGSISSSIGVRALKGELLDGFQLAEAEIKGGVLLDVNEDSKRKALYNLVEAFDHEYGSSTEPLTTRIDAMRSGLSEPPAKRPSFRLAFVRAAVEFDKSLQKAVDHVEKMEVENKRKSTRARRLLRRFLQVRQFVEILRGEDNWETADVPDPTFIDLLLAARWEAQSFKGAIYVDLHDWCRRISQHVDDYDSPGEYLEGLQSICNRISNRIESRNGLVISSRTTGADFQHAHGLSVYFPTSAADYSAKYRNLRFARDTGWARLVRAYLEITRRSRRGERTRRTSTKVSLRRYLMSEMDPLQADGIAGRIAAVPSRTGEATSKGGIGTKLGTSQNIRLGTSQNIRLGTSQNIRLGTSQNIRGEVVLQTFGNPPDGFYREFPE
jgi:hypothetical protein